MQQEIARSAYQYQQEVESAKRVIVGVNKFVEEEEPVEGGMTFDPTVEERHLAGLAKVKKERDNQKVRATLDQVRRAAEGTENLMGPVIEAVKAQTTMGEICGSCGRFSRSIGRIRNSKNSVSVSARVSRKHCFLFYLPLTLTLTLFWGIMPHLLSNVRILDLSRMLAGPFGSMLLGTWARKSSRSKSRPGTSPHAGAVPHGGNRAYFLAINRNKKSIVIDLTIPGGAKCSVTW